MSFKMIQLNRKVKDEVKNNIRVLVFGFDQCGFTLTTEKRESLNGIEYNYVPYSQHVDLAEYDVCVVPSGIFESIERYSSYMGTHEGCKYDKERLLEFDRMVINFLKNRKVLIFLMSDIRKEIDIGSYRTSDISETDLAKKMLLGFFPLSASHQVQPHLKHNRNEFQKYTEKYGVGKTRVFSNDKDLNFTTLISSQSDEVFGVELIDKRLFFLPYHTTKKDFKSLSDLLSLAVESVTNYIQNHTVNIPEWVKSFSFANEVSIQKKIAELKELIEVETEKQVELDSCKSILCNQGDPLAVEIIKILKKFFGLIVDDKDEKLDDFSILNEKGEIICSGEIKGVAGDCKRQYLSQLNANRDMKDYPVGMKGLLIINDGMKIKTISDKGSTTISNDCLIYALKENINILRTIDLLNLMVLVEDKTIDERRALFNKLLVGEAGWIKCDSSKMEIVRSK